MTNRATNPGNVTGIIFPLENSIPIIKFEYSINTNKEK